MLPDLASFKSALAERLARAVQERAVGHAPLLAQIKTTRQREGDRYSYETHEGQIEKRAFKTFRTQVVTRNLPSLIEQEREVGEKLDVAAQQIAKQHSELLFTTVTEASDQAGTAFNAQGRPFHMAMFVDALEVMSVDFDDEGRPQLPTIVMHPDHMRAIERQLPEWEKDPALRARWQDVIAKKKEEWRARENHRKLVG